MNKEEIKQICRLIHQVNNSEPLNMDDIDEIYKALKEFNGEVE